MKIQHNEKLGMYEAIVAACDTARGHKAAGVGGSAVAAARAGLEHLSGVARDSVARLAALRAVVLDGEEAGGGSDRDEEIATESARLLLRDLDVLTYELSANLAALPELVESLASLAHLEASLRAAPQGAA